MLLLQYVRLNCWYQIKRDSSAASVFFSPQIHQTATTERWSEHRDFGFRQRPQGIDQLTPLHPAVIEFLLHIISLHNNVWFGGLLPPRQSEGEGTVSTHATTNASINRRVQRQCEQVSLGYEYVQQQQHCVKVKGSTPRAFIPICFWTEHRISRGSSNSNIQILLWSSRNVSWMLKLHREFPSGRRNWVNFKGSIWMKTCAYTCFSVQLL